MSTFKDQLERLTTAKHKLAVWEALVSYLDDNFLSKDGRDASKGLLADECVEERVPEGTIDDVMNEIIEGSLSNIQAEISAIESSEVKHGTGKKGKKVTSKAAGQEDTSTAA